MAEPLFCSPIVGRTSAGRVGALGSAFGRPPMPWQKLAARLVTQDDGAGRPGIVVLTVQRQAGKTGGVIRDLILERCLLMGPSQRVWYTAQSGKYARDVWAEIVTDLCAEGSPLAGMVAARWSQGSELATFPNGSTFGPFPPTRDALHGKQSDLVIVDEAWRHDAATGAALEQAIIPTMATRPGAQLIITSAAGTADSVWFRSWVEKGRAGEVPYLEYGIGDDADPTDLDAVIAAHPAAGVTITEAFIRAQAAALPPGEFGRAFGNAWSRTMERTITADVWDAAATVDPLPDGPVVLVAEVAQDGSRSAILAAAGGIVEVVASEPGSAWLAARVVELEQRHDVVAVGIARTGPSAPIADAVESAGVTVHSLDTRTEAAASARFFTDLHTGGVRHRQHPALTEAAGDAVRRWIGDGWVWGRRASAGPIPELIAATHAHWWDLHRPAPEAAPLVYFA